MRIIVAGGRDFKDVTRVYREVTALIAAKGLKVSDVVLCCGMAHGADECGFKVALEKGIRVERYPADWDNLGSRAGFVRNTEMAKAADVLVAFWDGKSHGTKNMIEVALRHGLEVHVFRYGGEEERF